MVRSLVKLPFCHNSLMDKVNKVRGSGKKNMVINTMSRSSTVLPSFVGLTFGVHNGRSYTSVSINEDMVGHKLGEFSPTRTFHGHSGNKKVVRK